MKNSQRANQEGDKDRIIKRKKKFEEKKTKKKIKIQNYINHWE